MSETEYPLPPATFEFLTASLKMQVEMQLGMLHFGDEKDRPEPDFRLARHSIDMLAMLEEKTRGNLTTEEKRLIENSLTELRFRYIQFIEEKNKKQAAAVSEAPMAAIEDEAKGEEQAGS